MQCVTAGITLAELDAWLSKFTQSKAHGKLAPRFLETRVRDLGEDGCMKVFAGELLFIAPVLLRFCSAVLAPASRLVPHTHCFGLLVAIIELLRRGDQVLSELARLQSLIEEHHAAFVALYEASVRPKLHFLLHLPRVFELMHANVSCFPAERKHRFVKLLAANTFANFESTLTTTILNRQMWDLQQPTLFAAARVDNGIACDEDLEVFASFVDSPRTRVVATRANFAWAGEIRRGDLVLLGAGASEEQVGKVDSFHEVVSCAGKVAIFVQCDCLEPAGGCKYRTKAHPRLFESTWLRAALIYCESGAGQIEILRP